MPEENNDPQELTSETPVVERDQEKRRIKPVIEEISSSIPAMDEVKEERVDEISPVVEKSEEVVQKEEPQKEVAQETQPIRESDSDSKSDLKLFVVISVVTAVIVAALAGGIYVYLTGTNNSNPEPTPTPVSEVLPESSPEASLEESPAPDMKLSEYKVQILNGSGKIGEAGKAKTLVEKAGFKVGNTGNAESFDFTDTVIQVKTSVSPSVLDKVKEALTSTYSVESGEKLDSDSDYDIVITIGSK
jgi:hypothetical protein